MKYDDDLSGWPTALYDAPPPPVLLLQLTWDFVFSQLVPEEEYRIAAKRVHEIECTIDQIRDKLAEACGPPPIDGRNPPIPARDRVVKMFKHLEAMKIAKCVDRSAGKYTVSYRRKDMTTDFFVDKFLAIEAKAKAVAKRPSIRSLPRGRRKNAPGQMKLFGQ